MRKFILMVTTGFLCLAACKKSDSNSTPVSTLNKTPKACFNANKVLVDSGERVILTNCSENALTYQWSLGLPGQSLNTKNIDTMYQTRGEYNVQLVVYNGSLSDQLSQTISVGHRYLTKFVVHNFNTSPSPDFRIAFGPGSNTSQYITDTIKGLLSNQEYTLTIKNPIQLNASNSSGWTFRLQDVHSGSPIPITTLGGTVTPIYPSRGSNPIKLANSANADIDLVYEIRKP